jgi:hypothetical protein
MKGKTSMEILNPLLVITVICAAVLAVNVAITVRKDNRDHERFVRGIRRISGSRPVYGSSNEKIGTVREYDAKIRDHQTFRDVNR